jgi:hypothetical protein
MADKKTLSGRVPVDTYEEFQRLADERDVRKSDLLRRAAVEHLERLEGNDDPARSRSVSPVALVGVVALAIAPTLLATGYTALGVGAAGVAAAYVLLWATAYDVVLEHRLDAARDELEEVGGVVAFFRAVIRAVREDRTVDDPETLVERAANVDVLALGVLVAGTVLGAPVAVVGYLVGPGAVVETLGTTGALAWVVGLVGVFYLGALLLGVSAVATLAIASSRLSTDAAADDAA